MNQIDIYTFKDGLLSRVAHDLHLRLERFDVSVDKAIVTGRFWPDSLVVLGPIKRGRLDPKGLKPKDRAEIQNNIQKQILKTADHPTVELTAKRTLIGLEGTLQMRGHTRPIVIPTQIRKNQIEGEIELVPSQWGIAPFKALMGAIRLQDRVLVRFSIQID